MSGPALGPGDTGDGTQPLLAGSSVLGGEHRNANRLSSSVTAVVAEHKPRSEQYKRETGEDMEKLGSRDSARY